MSPGPIGTAAASRPRDGGAARQRARIVAAALDLLAERGPAGVTLRTLGARVGLHNSSLFHHFRGKQEILAAVQEHVNDGLLERLGALADDDARSLDRLIAVLGALSDHYAAHRTEARCAMRILLDPAEFQRAIPAGATAPREGDGARGARFTTLLWSWLARAQAAGTVRPVNVGQAARNLLGMLLLDPVWGSAAPRNEREDQRRRDELAAFVRGALAPEARRSP